MNSKLSVTFDTSTLLSFVQGEDRSFQLTFRDDTTGKPIDLTTAAKIQVNLPRLGGGTVKRMKTGFLIDNGALTLATGYISYEDHGLVENEIVRVSTTGVLPTGYVAATDYKVAYVDEDTFALKDATTGVLIKPTTQGTGDFTVTQQAAILFTSLVDNPVLGEVTLNLPLAVTSQIQDGLGQGFQCQFVDSDSDLRIIVLTNGLDVTDQPAP